MGKTCRCTGCETRLSEHAFGKSGKSCTGPGQIRDVSVVEEDTAPPSQSVTVEVEPNESIEATLASLLGAVKSFTIGLKEVQADNQQLRALLTHQSPIKEVPVPCISTGGATALGVTLPELRAMQGWRIPVIVTRTTARLSRPRTSALKTRVRQMVVVSL